MPAIFASTPNWPLFIAANAALLIVLFVAIGFMARRTLQLKRGGDNPLRYEGSVRLTVDEESGLDLISQGMKAMGAQSVQVDQENQVVRARTGMTRRSWGQYLEAWIETEDPGGSVCKCQSWPTFQGTLWDRGAGRLAVEAVFREMGALNPQALLAASSGN